MKFLSFGRLFGDRATKMQARTTRRRQRTRPLGRPPLTFDILEDRVVMATLPVPTVATNNLVATTNTTGDFSQPSIAVNPLNPQKLVAAYVRNDPPGLPAATPIVIQGAISTNGGVTWSGFG